MCRRRTAGLLRPHKRGNWRRSERHVREQGNHTVDGEIKLIFNLSSNVNLLYRLNERATGHDDGTVDVEIER